MNLTDDEGMMYTPSLEWAYWYMRVQMNLRLQKVCGAPVSPEARVKQDKLHNITLQRLAVRIADGLDPKYMIGFNQFGMHLFPQVAFVWTLKGDSEVKGALKEDKRQYTGDIVHNMMGEVIAVHSIFAGKSQASLPHPVVREKEELWHFHFSYTPNHWASLETSINPAKCIWQWVVEDNTKDAQAKGESFTRQQAKASPECVWLLDCWPVNTSREFRESVHKLAGRQIEILYVPAGGTGRYQVNDTHMHKPLKGHAQIVAGKWCSANLFYLQASQANRRFLSHTNLQRRIQTSTCS